MILTGKAKLAGVLGWPVGHSRSPRLHGFWLQQHGIDGAYLPLAVKPEDFEAVIRALPRMGFRGANVTVPHKEAALALADHVDPLARRIGAVNTLVVRDDGSLEGRNTDAFGFIENLRQGCPGFSAARGPAVVLGAGGAARAVVAALQDDGCPEIRLLNRSRERAEALKADLETVVMPGGNITVLPWDSRAAALNDAALLVNTTSLGMSGQPPLEISLGGFADRCLGHRYRLCSAFDRSAAGGAKPGESDCGWFGHAAAPGPAWVRGLVRSNAPRLRTNCGLSWGNYDHSRPHRLHRHGQIHGGEHAAILRDSRSRRR